MSAKLLIDNSAWARLSHAALPQARADEIASQVLAGEVAVCMPFLLEAGYSARSGDEHAAILEELGSLPHAAIDEPVERRAPAVQGQLARAGHHRLPPVDVLVATLADHHGLGVLHYDHDYDVIRESTGLSFESVWLAPRGSL